MIYHSYAPSPPLAEFVERVWLCLDAPAHRQVRILPSGTSELVINLCEDEVRVYDALQSDGCTRYSGVVVSGAYRGCLMIDPMQHSSIMGVHFKPAGAFPFLGAPADELADMHLDLETLWGTSAAELRERLRAASTVGQQFSLLENARSLAAAMSAPASWRGTHRAGDVRSNGRRSQGSRRGAPRRPQPAAVDPGIRCRSRSDAEVVLPRATLSKGAGPRAERRGARLARSRR